MYLTHGPNGQLGQRPYDFRYTRFCECAGGDVAPGFEGLLTPVLG